MFEEELEETEDSINRLTGRERQVLDHVVDGLSSREIAQELGVSTKTVEAHRARINDKMRADNVSHLIRMCFAYNEEHGIIVCCTSRHGFAQMNRSLNAPGFLGCCRTHACLVKSVMTQSDTDKTVSITLDQGDLSQSAQVQQFVCGLHDPDHDRFRRRVLPVSWSGDVCHVLDPGAIGSGVQSLCQFTEFADVLIVQCRDQLFNLLTYVQSNVG